jgi:hypothetical protein
MSTILLIALATSVLVAYLSFDLLVARDRFLCSSRRRPGEGLLQWWLRKDTVVIAIGVSVYLLVVLVVLLSAYQQWSPLLTNSLLWGLVLTGVLLHGRRTKSTSSRNRATLPSMRRRLRRWWATMAPTRTGKASSLQRLMTQLWHDIKPREHAPAPTLTSQVAAWWTRLASATKYFVGGVAGLSLLLVLFLIDLKLPRGVLISVVAIFILALAGLFVYDLIVEQKTYGDVIQKRSLRRRISTWWASTPPPTQYVMGIISALVAILALYAWGSSLAPSARLLLFLIAALCLFGFLVYAVRYEWKTLRNNPVKSSWLRRWRKLRTPPHRRSHSGHNGSAPGFSDDSDKRSKRDGFNT